MRTFRFAAALLLATSLGAQVAVHAQAEKGKFLLHKFEQPIGLESYTVTTNGSSTDLEADFAFTDRSTKVPLKASLIAADDGTPQSLTVKGKPSRQSELDVQVSIAGNTAGVRDGKQRRSVTVPAHFFTIAGYAPVSIQQALVRYWKAHGSPAQLAGYPAADIRITDRGPDTISIHGNPMPFERYSIRGLVWGLETVWLDAHNNLAALVTRDAEFDHFEALREEYEPALNDFVAAAAGDEMAELAELSRSLPGRRTGDFAFTGATLIDGTGAPAVKDAVIVTRAGKIVAAGPAASTAVPADATRIDLGGKIVIPGLWDMHAHYEQVEWGPIYLAAGVTSVRDVGNEFDFITAVRNKINSGAGLGPHMLNAGIVDGSGPMSLGINTVDTPEQAIHWVHKYHDAGFQQMKIYSSVTPEIVKVICAEAHKLGMTVTGHIPNGMNVYDGVNDGMDQVNHIQYIEDVLLPKDFDPRKAKGPEQLKAVAQIDVNGEAGKHLIKFLKDHHTVIDDTVALSEMGLRPATQPYDQIEPGAAKVAPELRDEIMDGGVPAAYAELAHEFLEKDLALVGALHRNGITLVAGTDQAVPGYSVYRELELYVQAGFTPMEALQAATIVPARVMKVDGETGTVEAGKRADFAILDRDPLEDIHNIRSVRQVVANGVLYDSAPLWKSVGFQP